MNMCGPTKREKDQEDQTAAKNREAEDVAEMSGRGLGGN